MGPICLKVLAFFSVVCVCHGSLGDFHTFTDAAGRSVEAKIIAYDEQRGEVHLELANRKRSKVRAEIFTEADQAFIGDWRILKGVDSSDTFQIDADKKVVENWKKELQNASKKKYNDEVTAYVEYEKIVYKVRLKNQNPFPLQNLKVEYRLFYDQDRVVNSKKEEQEKCLPGELVLPMVASRAEEEFTTTDFTIFDYRTAPGWLTSSGAPNRYGGEAKGIWLRITLTTKSGGVVQRDWCSPTNLMEHHQWKSVAELQPQTTPSSGKKKKGKKKSKKKGKKKGS